MSDLARLSDAAFLETILARTLASGTAAVAAELLHRFGDLPRAVAADPAALAPLVEPETARDLALVHDLARRLLAADLPRRDVLSSWSALTAYLTGGMAWRDREAFRVLFLDKKNQLLADEVMAEGTVDHAPVYPREVVRRALELSASALILVHNHPSGDPTPSSADVAMTRRVVDAARALDLAVHDHVVVGRHGTASFRALGLL